jgi:hypothetical protein
MFDFWTVDSFEKTFDFWIIFHLLPEISICERASRFSFFKILTDHALDVVRQNVDGRVPDCQNVDFTIVIIAMFTSLINVP